MADENDKKDVLDVMVRVSKKTKKTLRDMGKKDETYDSIITGLVEDRERLHQLLKIDR